MREELGNGFMPENQRYFEARVFNTARHGRFVIRAATPASAWETLGDYCAEREKLLGIHPARNLNGQANELRPLTQEETARQIIVHPPERPVILYELIEKEPITLPPPVTVANIPYQPHPPNELASELAS